MSINFCERLLFMRCILHIMISLPRRTELRRMAIVMSRFYGIMRQFVASSLLKKRFTKAVP